jgi:hypothetical protein
LPFDAKALEKMLKILAPVVDQPIGNPCQTWIHERKERKNHVRRFILCTDKRYRIAPHFILFLKKKRPTNPPQKPTNAEMRSSTMYTKIRGKWAAKSPKKRFTFIQICMQFSFVVTPPKLLQQKKKKSPR